MITEINEINRDTEEGRLLLAALSFITSKYETDKTPYDVLSELNDLADKMFVDPTELDKTIVCQFIPNTHYDEVDKRFIISEIKQLLEFAGFQVKRADIL